jgi:hypothetical protein
VFFGLIFWAARELIATSQKIFARRREMFAGGKTQEQKL